MGYVCLCAVPLCKFVCNLDDHPLDKDLEKWLLEGEIDQSAIQRVSQNTFLASLHVVIAVSIYMYSVYLFLLCGGCVHY